MPFKRRYRKRSVKRRRVWKTRRKRSSKRYDGAVWSKLIYSTDLTVDAGLSTATHLVSWGRYAATTAGYSFPGDTPEYAARRLNAREFCIRGVKIVYTPLGDLGGGAALVASRNGWSASCAGNPSFSLATTQVTGQQMPDYKTFDANRVFKRYYNSGKYFAKRNYRWLNISDADAYPTAYTLIQIGTSGFAQGDIVGTITCTWYMGTRGYK